MVIYYYVFPYNSNYWQFEIKPLIQRTSNLRDNGVMLYYLFPPSCFLPRIHPAINDRVIHGIRHSHKEYDNVYLLYKLEHRHTRVVVGEQEIHVHWQPAHRKYYNNHNHHLHHLNRKKTQKASFVSKKINFVTPERPQSKTLLPIDVRGSKNS